MFAPALGGAVAALLVALLGLGAALGPSGEEAGHIGLRWLFLLRGQVAPPERVVVITIDRQSARDLKQSVRTDEWSRGLHARLVDVLDRAGAALIVFDVFFARPGDGAEDRALADALQRSGKVILSQRVDRLDHGDRLRNPHPPLTAAAAALAPFPLPKIPEKVSYYWPFYTVVEPHDAAAASTCRGMPGGRAEDPGAARSGAPVVLDVVEVATMPVAALQLLALGRHGPAELVSGLADEGAGPDAAGARAFCALQYTLRSGLKGRAPPLPERGGVLGALDRTMAFEGVAYLNFYGPPRSIRTHRYADIIAAAEQGDSALLDGLDGAFVFIGAGEVSAVDQTDAFPTVFTTRSGLDIAGVEIAATAFANLIEDNPVRAVAPITRALAITAFAVLAVLAGMLVPGLSGPLAIVAAAACYVVFAHWQFSAHAAWWPLFTPLAVQAPAALVLTQLWKHLSSRAESDRYLGFARRFLPKSAMKMLASGSDPDAEPEAAYGVCMMTDIASYTAVAERLDVFALSRLQNEYFALLEGDVQACRGDILRVEGDSLAAIWSGDDERAMRINACRAALAMARSVEDFNHRHPDTRFATRFGLMAGDIVLGRVGGAGRFTYTGTGSAFVIATRLEAANKPLGTSILCGAEVVANLDEFTVRRLGRFLLKGRQTPNEVCQLLQEGPASNDAAALIANFSRALEYFETGDFLRAAEIFETLAAAGDGPSIYYSRLCRQCLDNPPRGRVAHIRLEGGEIKTDIV